MLVREMTNFIEYFCSYTKTYSIPWFAYSCFIM